MQVVLAILLLLAPWALSTAAFFWLLSWDERRLGPEAQARAFPPATKRAAVVMFGPLALAVHGARTRRGAAKGLAAVVGLAAALAVQAVVVALASAAADALGVL